MVSYDFDFTHPYYDGTGVSSLVPQQFPVAIHGHPYLIDERKYSRRLLPVAAEQQDVGEESGEHSLNREGFWRRSQSDWSFGAGQEFYDEEGSDRRRFFTSKGVDVWEERSLCLLPDTELKTASSATTQKLLSTNGFLYWADGRFLRFTSDPTVASPMFTSIDMGVGVEIKDVTSDGVNVYIALGGDGLHKATIGAGSSAAFGSLTPDIVEFANGRLIAADSNDLYEIDSTGAKSGGVSIRTDPRTSFVWVAIAGAPSAIFVAGNVDNRSEIYALAADDVTTALSAPTWASGLPVGETMNAMLWYSSVVLFGTSEGLRVALIVGRSLEYGEVIEIDGGVGALDALAEFCWFTWSNFDAVSTGLGRANLAINTSEFTLVPAYASDILADVTGTVTGVASHDDKRYFTISGSGLWGEEADRVATGTINSGWIRYSTLIPKLFSGAAIGHDTLVGSVSGTAMFLDGTQQPLGSSKLAGSQESQFFNARGAGVAAQFVLDLARSSSDTTLGPCVRYWTLHSLPVSKRVTEFIVPIWLKTEVKDLKGLKRRFDPRLEFEFLEFLGSENVLVNYQEGDRVVEVRVDSVAIDEGDAPSWQQDHNWFQCLALVRLLSKEQ